MTIEPILHSRRRVLIGAVLSLAAAPAWAADFAYKGWRFDTGGVHGALPDALIQSLQAQIDIVESIDFKPEIKAFFHSVPLEIDKRTSGGDGAYSFREHRMRLSVAIDPPENPVFLHELLHAYHEQRLPGGLQNAKVLGYYAAAKRSGAFPPQAYMLKDPIEFFAMCASVVLWGRAARPPGTREHVHQVLPDMYDWIVGEFTATGVI